MILIHNYMVLKHNLLYYFFMQYGEFHKRVRKSGLSIKGFAEFVGMDRRSISNYSKKGEVPDHLALIALLLAELVKYEVEPSIIQTRLDALGRRPRKRGAAKATVEEEGEDKVDRKARA